MAVLDRKECQLQSGNKTSSTTLKSKYQKVQIEEEVLKILTLLIMMILSMFNIGSE